MHGDKVTDRKACWQGFSWEKVEAPTYNKTPDVLGLKTNTVVLDELKGPVDLIEDSHEALTFGPLSSDPLVNPKKAKGAVKAPFHATPELANIQMSNVMAGGGWKYGDFNYHESSVDAQTYLSAMRRHYLLWKDGVDLDRESGQNHLAHVMACCAILIEAQATGKFIDNRSKTGVVEAALLQSSATFNIYCESVEPIK